MSPIHRLNNKILVPVSGEGLCKTCCVEYSEYPCGYCSPSPTPRYLTISFAGLTDCECQSSNGTSYRFTGIATALNGNSYLLGPKDGPGCLWTGEWGEGSYGARLFYNGDVCAGGPVSTIELDTLYIMAERCAANGLRVWANVRKPFVGVARAFSYVQPYDTCKNYGSIEDCMSIVDLDSTITDCVWLLSDMFIKGCYGGTCTIQEGDHT